MADIVEIRGNIFESTCQTFVNTVNCVGVMGKGIALEFKNRYPDMFQAYQVVCEKGLLKPGKLLLYKESEPWILNFPTKFHWKHPSKLEYIESGLQKFAETYRNKSIESVAFPQLGTSAGGLDWKEVRLLMLRFLEPLKDLRVEIYQYDPKANDSLFIKLKQQIKSYTLEDYINTIGLRKRQARVLFDAIQTDDIQGMQEIQNLKGFGDKSIECVYDYLRHVEGIEIKAKPEAQLILPF